MEIEFKEKPFEKYFSHEIARLTNTTFSPDQCDEAFLGFDDAFFVPHRWMGHWGLLRKRKQRMSGITIGEIDLIDKELNFRMPKYKFNLFVQYKRPVFLKTHGAGEWEHWKCPYYRYVATPHQQKILEKIETKSAGRAATIYASPAFWKAKDLFDLAKANKVIENSNIADAAKLKGHSRYSYTLAGNKGKGHSEATEIESYDFGQIIETGLQQDELSFGSHVKRIAKVILESIEESRGARALFEHARGAMGVEDMDERSIYGALLTIEAFSDAFGVSYLALG